MSNDDPKYLLYMSDEQIDRRALKQVFYAALALGCAFLVGCGFLALIAIGGLK